MAISGQIKIIAEQKEYSQQDENTEVFEQHFPIFNCSIG